MGLTGGGVAEGETHARLHAATNNGTVVGDRDVDLHRGLAPYFDGLVVEFQGEPLVVELVGWGSAGSQALQVEVLVVRTGVGDAPCHAVVMPEMREARDTGEGKADDVEIGAGDVVLVVDVGGIEGAMGVACQNGRAGCGAWACQHPVVAAHFDCLHGLDPSLGFAQEVGDAIDYSFVFLAGRHYDQLALLVAGAQGGHFFGPDLTEQFGTPQLLLENSHEDVANLEHTQGIVGAPGFGGGLEYLVFDG